MSEASGELLSFSQVISELTASPLGYFSDGDGKPWPPMFAHDEHTYEFNCAICRAGDRPDALAAVVRRVLNLGAPRADQSGSQGGSDVAS